MPLKGAHTGGLIWICSVAERWCDGGEAAVLKSGWKEHRWCQETEEVVLNGKKMLEEHMVMGNIYS